MSECARVGAQWATPTTTRVALVVSADDMTLEYRPPDIDALTRHLQARGVEVEKSRHIGRAKGSVRQVEVLQMGSVRTSILEDLDPHPKPLTPYSAQPQSGKAQYASLAFTDKLALDGVAPSIGSVGDAYDNALIETINGPYKAECIRTTVFHEGPYRTIPDVKFATASWVDWYNTRRLHSSLG